MEHTKHHDKYRVHLTVPIEYESMTEEMRKFTDDTIKDLLDTAKFCDQNRNTEGYRHLPRYGKFKSWSALLNIIVENDGSKKVFLDVELWFKHNKLIGTYFMQGGVHLTEDLLPIEDLSEDLINKYCNFAFLITAKNFADNFSKCEFTLKV